jgi:DNA-binding CsgD family transcriptional regulator/tetratricopeptide (TPR) repeat protein
MALLERETQLAEIERRLRDAADGKGGLLFLGGEAGVGKTALVQHVLSIVQNRARVMTGACDPMSTPRPLAPLIDIAAEVGGDLGQLLITESRRDRLFHAFLGVLDGGRLPALAVIEDVHWADEATLDLLRFLGRRLGAVRALVIATYRDDEVGPAHPLRVVLGDLATASAVRRMALSSLSASAVRLLARDSGLDAVELYRRTGGNPFFLTEVLAAGTSGIPPTVRDAVLARAARLSPSVRKALDAAAVLGVRVERDLLAWLADDEGVDACIAAGVMQVAGDGIAFRHELARQAILETIPPHRALDLNRRTLDRLTALQSTDSARLAHHAEAVGDAKAVLEYAPEAARRAAAVGAHREAAAQYSRALRFAAGQPPGERAGLLEAFAGECTAISRFDEAIAARQEALAIWRALGDRPREGETLAHLASYLVTSGRNLEAEEYSRAAIELLQTLPPGPELATASRVQSSIRMLNRDYAEAVAWGENAIRLGEQFGQREAVVSALNSVGSALLLEGDERGREHLERSLRLAQESGMDGHVAVAYANLGSAAGELYQFPVADRYLADGIAYCAERDLDASWGYLLAWQALSHLYQGRWPEAAEVARAVLHHPSPTTISRIMALLALGRLGTRRGDREAAAILDESLALAAPTRTLQRLGSVHAARAEAAWTAGDVEACRAEARATYDLAVHHRHPWHTGELFYWRRLAEDPELAGRTPPPWTAEPWAHQIAGDWVRAAKCWQDLSCPYEAARALAEGDDEVALKQALQTFERLGARPMAARLSRRLRRLGARGIPRGPRAATRANPANLTSRQIDVLVLITLGLRNAEIAERLILSPKTVDHHVSAVLAKLGVHTRTEAAHEALRLGYAPQHGEPSDLT